MGSFPWESRAHSLDLFQSRPLGSDSVVRAFAMPRYPAMKAHYWLGLGCLLSLSACQFLEEYPGASSSIEAQLDQDFQQEGLGPIDGAKMTPLVDPPTDGNVVVRNLLEAKESVLPGYPFNISLEFLSYAPNVVGGGIRLPGSDEVQWTFLYETPQTSGAFEFSFVLGPEACQNIPPLCHEFVTEQFAITQTNGVFAISRAVKVPVVLQCASCQSVSCINLLEAGTCRACGQPDECAAYWDRCFARGKPEENSDVAPFFDLFMGRDGSLWSTSETCAQGKSICTTGLQKGPGCEL